MGDDYPGMDLHVRLMCARWEKVEPLFKMHTQNDPTAAFSLAEGIETPGFELPTIAPSWSGTQETVLWSCCGRVWRQGNPSWRQHWLCARISAAAGCFWKQVPQSISNMTSPGLTCDGLAQESNCTTQCAPGWVSGTEGAPRLHCSPGQSGAAPTWTILGGSCKVGRWCQRTAAGIASEGPSLQEFCRKVHFLSMLSAALVGF